MAAPAPAEIALVHYVDDVPYHQRLILAWVTDTEYVVATPDFDLFIEQLDFTNPALDGLRLPGAGQAMGVGAGNVYTFAAIPDGTERAALVQEGARMAAMERVRRGLPPVPGGAGAVGAGGAGQGPAPPLPIAGPGVPAGLFISPPPGPAPPGPPGGPAGAAAARLRLLRLPLQQL